MRYAGLLLMFCLATMARGGDWLTAPSFYTHDPMTGWRTNQYASPPPAIVPQNPTFRDSGFRHYRSTIQFGQTADNYHRVEEWGPPIRPYGEWRFPYRPYSVPYDQWGAPLAGLNVGGYGPHHHGHLPYGYDPYGHHPYSRPAQVPFHAPGNPHPVPTQPPLPHVPYPSGPGRAYPVPPYADGYYPDYPVRPRLDDSDFFQMPSP